MIGVICVRRRSNECGRQFVVGTHDEDTAGQLLAEASEVVYRDVDGDVPDASKRTAWDVVFALQHFHGED